MPYNISQVQYHTLKDGNKYFLDANIWLEILTSRNSQSFKNKQYKALFNNILKNNKVGIVLPALIVSEVVNRILREVHMQKFAHKNGISKGAPIPSEYYKNTFRPSPEFKIAYNAICDDIKGYHHSIELINDSFGTDFKYKHVLSDPPTGLDFNDFYYYSLCKKNNYIIVTDDKDFWVEDVTIITQSPTLIEKQNQLTAIGGTSK